LLACELAVEVVRMTLYVGTKPRVRKLFYKSFFLTSVGRGLCDRAKSLQALALEIEVEWTWSEDFINCSLQDLQSRTSRLPIAVPLVRFFFHESKCDCVYVI
jgi:hypothetical protein